MQKRDKVIDSASSARRTVRQIGTILTQASPQQLTERGAAFAFLVGLQMADSHPVWARAVLRWLPNKSARDLVDLLHKEFALHLDKVENWQEGGTDDAC